MNTFCAQQQADSFLPTVITKTKKKKSSVTARSVTSNSVKQVHASPLDTFSIVKW